MYILPASIYVHHECAWCLQKPEKGIRSPVIGITDDCELTWMPGIKLRSSASLLSHLSYPKLRNFIKYMF